MSITPAAPSPPVCPACGRCHPPTAGCAPLPPGAYWTLGADGAWYVVRVAQGIWKGVRR